MWETNITAGGRLFYRRDGGGWTEAAEPGTRKIHEVRVGGFAPDEAVDYYVESRAAGDSVVSEVSSFRTNPAADDLPFNFVVWGDNQANPPVFTSLVQRMLPYSPELGVAVGDVVDAGNDYYRWGEELLTPLRPLAKSVPFYVAIGNHEANAHWFYDYLAQPGNEHWFSFDYAGCHFVIIDSNFPFGPGSEQYEWLRGDLFSAAAQEARWLFTFHHHPPYSEIYEEVIYARLRMHLVPLFETAGVDVNFTGHIHDYERGVYVPPDTGRRIAYVQTSGAGGRLWDDEFTGEYEQIQRVIQYVHHYCEIAIAGETLTLRAIDLQGRVIDSFTLTREPRNAGPPPPPPPPPPEGLAVTQWDFEAGDLTATFGPGTLEYLDRDGGATAAGTRFGSTASFGIPGIGGQAAQVMKFPRAASPGLGFRVEPGAPPNGGGSHVNDYTMVFDLCVPASSFKADSWLSFFNTNAENANDGELFLRLDTGGIGISGAYSGRILPNVWHRVATVFRSEGGEIVLHKFIDGAEVGSQALGPADGRWAIYTLEAETPWFLLFTDDNGETSSAYLSSLVFADRALSAAEVASLGGADADGILDGPCIGDCPPAFVRGDANADGAIDIGDALFILFAASGAAVVSDCPKSQDANDDGAVQVTDVVYLLNYLFLNGAVVKPPFPGCGADPTADALPCAAPGPCE
jgi:hypothetical protein